MGGLDNPLETMLMELQQVLRNFTCSVLALLVDPATLSDVISKCVNCYSS